MAGNVRTAGPILVSDHYLAEESAVGLWPMRRKCWTVHDISLAATKSDSIVFTECTRDEAFYIMEALEQVRK